MKVLIAPAPYKESISAIVAAEIMESVVREAGEISIKQPISDGGEDFVSAFISKGATPMELEVYDPLGRQVNARLCKYQRTAIIEMAAASGLELVAESDRDPVNSSTYGTGQLIHFALNLDVDTIVVGMGGSATNDGGMGMIRAMGGKFIDASGSEIIHFRDVQRINTIDFSIIRKLAKGKRIIGATDVINPLLGPEGATMIFGFQKGLSPVEAVFMEANMQHYAHAISEPLQINFANEPGSGAAGGLGFGILAAFGGQLESGFEILSRETGLEEMIAEADMIITGEGKFDGQSAYGKAPQRILEMAKSQNKPIYAVVGSFDKSVQNPGFANIYELKSLAGSTEEAMKNADVWIKKATHAIIKEFRESF